MQKTKNVFCIKVNERRFVIALRSYLSIANDFVSECGRGTLLNVYLGSVILGVLF